MLRQHFIDSIFIYYWSFVWLSEHKKTELLLANRKWHWTWPTRNVVKCPVYLNLSISGCYAWTNCYVEDQVIRAAIRAVVSVMGQGTLPQPTIASLQPREGRWTDQTWWPGPVLSLGCAGLSFSTDSFRPDRPELHQPHLFGELETFRHG